MPVQSAGRIGKLYEAVDVNRILNVLKQGLIYAIPILMAGCAAVMLLNLPIPPYQSFLDGLLGGAVRELLAGIQRGTLDVLSLVMLITISFSYAQSADNPRINPISCPIVSACSYIVFAGSHNQTDIFSASWLFTAIMVALTASILFDRFSRIKWLHIRNHADGADAEFNLAFSAILPAGVVLLVFAAVNVVIVHLFGAANFQELFSRGLSLLFENRGRNLGSSLLYIFLLHFLWFCGIHGGNVMEPVAGDLFEKGLSINAQLAAAGQAPTEIFTKTFFDTFVLMGGCGSALCLLIAILVTSKRRNVKKLAKISLVPMLFNINELLLFGLPVIFNPMLLIPFILTPILLTLTSCFAVATGLVGCTVQSVHWTTPVLLSGYAATGSVAGSVLQLINLAVGILIYLPFVRISQERYMHTLTRDIEKLTDFFKQHEARGIEPALLVRRDRLGSTAKMLVSDLRYALKNGGVHLWYQPQTDETETVVGAEALLRWEYKNGGYLYPPLLIALAAQDGLLDELGYWIFQQVCEASVQLEEMGYTGLNLSVNVSAAQLSDPDFAGRVRCIVRESGAQPANIGVELTEQTALSGSTAMMELLFDLREFGMKLILDDFGMGHSSMLYLQNNEFDIVKLDGSLVRELLTNARCTQIVSSIVYLSNSLGFSMIAEFVETEAQRDTLAEIGCTIYQGYLYSPAVPFSEFLQYLKRHKKPPAAPESMQ